MSESLQDRNKAFYRRYLDELFTRGRVELADELLAPDYVLHDAMPGTPPGPEGVKRAVQMFRAGFPDLRIEVHDLLAEGDFVVARSTTHGTHRGEIFGIAPTGRTIAMNGMTWVRIANGRVAESWVSNDVAGLMRQLNAK